MHGVFVDEVTAVRGGIVDIDEMNRLAVPIDDPEHRQALAMGDRLVPLSSLMGALDRLARVITFEHRTLLAGDIHFGDFVAVGEVVDLLVPINDRALGLDPDALEIGYLSPALVLRPPGCLRSLRVKTLGTGLLLGSLAAYP